MNKKYFPVVFYKTEGGHEPVREWLKGLTAYDRKSIGEDIKTVQFGWPLGMPLIKKVDAQLWEVRSRLLHKITRVIFTVHEGYIILLHGFIKKSQRIPDQDLQLAKERLRHIKRGSA